MSTRDDAIREVTGAFLDADLTENEQRLAVIAVDALLARYDLREKTTTPAPAPEPEVGQVWREKCRDRRLIKVTSVLKNWVDWQYTDPAGPYGYTDPGSWTARFEFVSGPTVTGEHQ